MASGLKIPVRVDKSGGAAIEEGSQGQLKKLLFLALSEGGDDNPFQRIGLGAGLLFRVKDAALRGFAQREVERVLAQFSDRLQLLPEEPFTFDETAAGEVQLSFRYVDLEVHRVDEFSTQFVR